MTDGSSGGSLNFELLAASLRADSADARTWVAVLGQKLDGALPSRVRLHRGGLFGNGAIDGMAAELGDWRFTLRLERGEPLAERVHIVRGINLKSETLSLDAWIDALVAALAEIAAASARERDAIQALLR